MSIIPENHAGEATSGSGAPLIVAQASSARGPSDDYEALYGRPARKAAPQEERWSKGRWPKTRWPKPNGMLVTAGLCLSLAMAAIGARETVVRFVPAAAGLYAAIHLPVNLRGIDIRDARSTLSFEAGRPVLTVEGTLVNLRKRDTDVPRLAVALRGPDGREIYGWTASASKARLGPGEALAFSSRLAAPPDNARETVLRFAGSNDASKAGQ